MLSNSIKGLALALAVAVLGGCATSKEKLLPHHYRMQWLQLRERVSAAKLKTDCVEALMKKTQSIQVMREGYETCWST